MHAPPPGLLSYTLAMACCVKSSSSAPSASTSSDPTEGPNRALKLLNDLQKAGFAPDTEVYGLALTACQRAGNWKRALRLAQEAQGRSVPLSGRAWSTVISTCEAARPSEREQALAECKPVLVAAGFPIR